MKAALALAAVAIAVPAWAQEGSPRFCPNNPSLESSACTTEPGRVHVEVTALDWQREKRAGEREDRYVIGDTLVRVGVGRATEVQVDWSPLGVVRERDAGGVTRRTRAGDVTLALRQNLRNPDGSGLSYGVQPFVTLPVGRRPVGDGTWSAGVIVPVTYDIAEGMNVGATAEVDALADEDGRGRHLLASMVIAAAFDLSDTLSVTTEAQLLRDRDPAGRTTQAVGGLGVTYKVAKTRALFAEAVAGLNRDAPDIRLYAGLAALF